MTDENSTTRPTLFVARGNFSDVPLPDMPAGPSPEDIALIGLRKRFLELAAKIEDYEAEQETIKANIRRLGAGTHAIGDGKVTITPQKRFDPELAETVLTGIDPALVVACSVAKIDSALARKILSPALYDQCKKPGGEDRVLIV